MRWIVIALAAMLAGLAIVGCGGSRETTFGEDDGSVEVEAGDRFRIELAANPGVGDDWSLAQEPDPSVAVLVAHGFEERRRRGRGRRRRSRVLRLRGAGGGNHRDRVPVLLSRLRQRRGGAARAPRDLRRRRAVGACPETPVRSGLAQKAVRQGRRRRRYWASNGASEDAAGRSSGPPPGVLRFPDRPLTESQRTRARRSAPQPPSSRRSRRVQPGSVGDSVAR